MQPLYFLIVYRLVFHRILDFITGLGFYLEPFFINTLVSIYKHSSNLVSVLNHLNAVVVFP